MHMEKDASFDIFFMAARYYLMFRAIAVTLRARLHSQPLMSLWLRAHCLMFRAKRLQVRPCSLMDTAGCELFHKFQPSAHYFRHRGPGRGFAINPQQWLGSGLPEQNPTIFLQKYL